MSNLAAGQLAEQWTPAATAYDALATDVTTQVAKTVLERMGVSAGDAFLDVAAGPGAAALAAAGMGARVTAIDFSQGMIDVLERRCRDANLDGVEARVMDGQALDLPDDTFDAASSLFGLTFFPELARGFSELHRVLKPGGRVVVTADARPEDDEFSQVFGAALVSVVPDFGAGDPGELPVTQRLAQPGAMQSHLADAGFEEVEVEVVSMPWPMPDPAAAWQQLQAGLPQLDPLFEALGPEVAAQVGAEFCRRVGEGAGDGIPSVDIGVVVGYGRKPPGRVV